MTRPRQSTGLDLVVRPAREEAALWRRLRLEAEAGCRETLFDRYVGLARSIAARHFHRRRPPRPELCDFQQFAYEGLLQAIDRYDPLLGAPFTAFARRRIGGSIADGVSRMSEGDAQFSHRHRIEQERLRSLARTGAAAEGDALAALSDLALGLAIGLMLEGTSLVAGETSVDPAPTAYDSLAYRELQVRLAGAVGALPEKEAIIVRQHYENGLSFTQIAELLNLSKGRISQLHHAALDRLRRKIGTL
jgi:RNA polymerase sigma factor for flagellar operon FliA